MLSFNISSPGLDELIERVEDVSYRLTDLRGLATRVGELMAEDVLSKALAGEDKDGVPFDSYAPLSDLTLMWKPPRAPGPPLAPGDYGSRLVQGFDVEVNETGWDRYEVVGWWPGFPELVYHVDGYHNALTGTQVPARDPVGIRPVGWASIEEALDEFVDNVLGGGY